MRRRNEDIDVLLGETRPRQLPVRPPSKYPRKPILSSIKTWASSQVAAYRVGLVLSYVAMMYFGASALMAGVPAFDVTTPEGWTPIWSSVVILGGMIGAVGSLRAGAEPITREVKIFNAIETTGAIMLFLALGTYAAVLLILGFGYSSPGRVSGGAGFIALGINPTVRMLWLTFRPRFLALNNRMHHIKTGSYLMVPTGYALVKTDTDGIVIPETPEEIERRIALYKLDASDAALRAERRNSIKGS